MPDWQLFSFFPHMARVDYWSPDITNFPLRLHTCSLSHLPLPPAVYEILDIKGIIGLSQSLPRYLTKSLASQKLGTIQTKTKILAMTEKLAWSSLFWQQSKHALP